MSLGLASRVSSGETRAGLPKHFRQKSRHVLPVTTIALVIEVKRATSVFEQGLRQVTDAQTGVGELNLDLPQRRRRDVIAQLHHIRVGNIAGWFPII